MSPPVVCPRLCVHGLLGYGVLLLVFIPLLTAGRQGNCSHPVVPEHGGFRCEPSPCRGFPQKSAVHYFCEPGYHIPGRTRSSKCHHATWVPPAPSCVPLKERQNKEENLSQPLPSVATTAVGVSIFLLTTTACMVLKSRLYPCHSPSRRSSDQLDLMVEGGVLPVPLPSYEEAVYGSWGQRLGPSLAGPGPTQLLLGREELDDPRTPPGHAPPPYEEETPAPRDDAAPGSPNKDP